MAPPTLRRDFYMLRVADQPQLLETIATHLSFTAYLCSAAALLISETFVDPNEAPDL